MTFQKTFINKKIEEIIDYLKEVDELFKLTDEEILADLNKLHSTERLLQLIVDITIDINEHFIKELGLKVSEDYQGTFTILADNGILPKDFALKIAPVVGLRNRIVHRYEEIDKSLFLETFRADLGDFRKYLDLVNKYLNAS